MIVSQTGFKHAVPGFMTYIREWHSVVVGWLTSTCPSPLLFQILQGIFKAHTRRCNNLAGSDVMYREDGDSINKAINWLYVPKVLVDVITLQRMNTKSSLPVSLSIVSFGSIIEECIEQYSCQTSLLHMILQRSAILDNWSLKLYQFLIQMIFRSKNWKKNCPQLNMYFAWAILH